MDCTKKPHMAEIAAMRPYRLTRSVSRERAPQVTRKNRKRISGWHLRGLRADRRERFLWTG